MLKNGISITWDEVAQKAFDALKHALNHTPLLHPPGYHRDYFLYLATFDVTIGMILVQEDESNEEHVTYYLTRNLTKTKAKYAYVEKYFMQPTHKIEEKIDQLI